MLLLLLKNAPTLSSLLSVEISYCGYNFKLKKNKNNIRARTLHTKITMLILLCSIYCLIHAIHSDVNLFNKQNISLKAVFVANKFSLKLIKPHLDNATKC